MVQACLSDQLEREVKLHIDQRFRLPELPGVSLPPRIFTSTYYDTKNLRLAHRGLTLRCRTEGKNAVWQLKIPYELGRREIEFAGPARVIPAHVSDLLLAYHRGRRLVPIATLRTRRSSVQIVESGTPAAEVVVDAVSILHDGAVQSRFRQVEIEQLGENDTACRRIEDMLRGAGASSDDPRPKVFRVLNVNIPDMPRIPDSEASPHEHLKAHLQKQVRAVLLYDPGTRLGADSEDLHQMRVATRRLRAYLRAARPLLVPAWTDSLRFELAWLGRALGDVRDLDVLTGSLSKAGVGLPLPERRAIDRLVQLLKDDRQRAHTALITTLRSKRYLELLDRLDRAARSPQTTGASALLIDIAAAEFKKLRRVMREVTPDTPDRVLHRARIRGKRSRYAAELAECLAGKPATRFLEAAKGFQDALGLYQDAVVAQHRLRELVQRVSTPHAAYMIGRLIERQSRSKERLREVIAKEWKRLDKRGRKAWL